RMTRSMVGTAGVVMLLAAVTGGCKKGGDAPPDPPMPPSAPLAVSSAMSSSHSVEYAIDPAGKTSIDMPAPKERIKGETTAAKGALHVDLGNLALTRGDVFVDMDTFATHTFGDAEKDATQTHHAHTWLQLDDNMKDTAARERNRWVHFAIRSIDGLSATDLSKVAPTKVGGDDVRTVTLVAHGDIELHSLLSKTQKDAALEVRFHVPAGSPDGTKPTSIELVGKADAPLQITLADHDVKPRDTEGILAQKAFGLLGTKVADVANVSVNLVARPSS
ncbi:MAG: hypothetical protein ACLQVI_38970, partial [Polyangiaceae bacterium]